MLVIAAAATTTDGRMRFRPTAQLAGGQFEAEEVLTAQRKLMEVALSESVTCAHVSA